MVLRRCWCAFPQAFPPAWDWWLWTWTIPGSWERTLCTVERIHSPRFPVFLLVVVLWSYGGDVGFADIHPCFGFDFVRPVWQYLCHCSFSPVLMGFERLHSDCGPFREWR